MLRNAVAILALCAALAAPVALAKPVSFPFGPEAGTTWKVVEKRNKVTSGKPTSGDVIITATLKVIEVTDDGYVMEWTTDSLKLGNITLNASNADPGYLFGVPLRYTADSEASPTRLIDFDTHLDQMAGVLGLAKDPQAKQKVSALFNAMSSENLANLLLKEAALFGQCHNLEVNPDEPVETQIYVESPLGGPAILTNVSVELQSAGSASKPARVVVSSVQDPQSASNNLIASIRKLGGEAAAKAALVDGKAPLVHNNHTFTCHVDTRTGEAVRVVSEADVVTKDSSVHDKRDITFTRKSN